MIGDISLYIANNLLPYFEIKTGLKSHISRNMGIEIILYNVTFLNGKMNKSLELHEHEK